MKRLVGVLTVMNGWVVGSYGFKQWLPVGEIAHQIEELERWQVDEIALLDISSSDAQIGLDGLLDAIKKSSPLTPILVGGSIASMDSASRVLSGGADRVLLGSGAFTNLALVDEVSSTFGDQAVVLAVPVARSEHPQWCEPKSGGFRPLEDLRHAVPGGWGGELLVMDVSADGGRDSFDLTLLDDVSHVIPEGRIMVFGGFRSPQFIDEVLIRTCVSAVCLGNVCHQREIFIRKLKGDLIQPVRQFMTQP